MKKEQINQNGLAGAAQSCNHKGDSTKIYVGKFFMGIDVNRFKSIGSPSFRGTDIYDTGGLVSSKFPNCSIWYPTHVEIPRWNLGKVGMFGLGTTYENTIYHQFNISKTPYWDNVISEQMFIKKCNSIVN